MVYYGKKNIIQSVKSVVLNIPLSGVLRMAKKDIIVLIVVNIFQLTTRKKIQCYGFHTLMGFHFVV